MSRLGSTYWPVVALIVGLGFILWGAPANAEEPPTSAEKPAAAMSERCEAWLIYMVDGNGLAPLADYRIGSALWNEVAKECLGRPANPLAPKVHPEYGLQFQAPAPPDPAPPTPKLTL